MKYSKQILKTNYHNFHFCGELNPDMGKNTVNFLRETKMPNTKNKERLNMTI